MDSVQKSDLTANLLALNPTVSDFREWLFEPGMAHGDIEKWWGQRSGRQTRHEGLDLVSYVDNENRQHHLDETVIVPPLFRGRLVKEIDDFLGRTLVIAHEIANRRGQILHGFYAHLLPADATEIGKIIAENEGMAMIAPGNQSCPAHLHISTVWISAEYPIEQLSWRGFGETDGFHPCDPLDFIR